VAITCYFGYKWLIMVISGNYSNSPLKNIYLVGGLEHVFYDFPDIGNVSIPTDELHHFSEGYGSTTNQIYNHH